MLSVKSCNQVSQCFLFNGLSDDQYADIIQHGHPRHVAKGGYFFHQGEEASFLCVLQEGRVKLTQLTHDGHQVIVDFFGPGNGLGVIVALSNMDFPLSAEAVEDCMAVCWDRDEMKQLMLRFPQMALNGMEMIGGRFARLQDRFRDLSTRQVEQRVARSLLRLVRQFGRRVEDGVLIDIPLSRQDLAEMTGTNMYNVSRILSKWEHQGYVHNGRKRVVLCKSHEIVALAEDLNL